MSSDDIWKQIDDMVARSMRRIVPELDASFSDFIGEDSALRFFQILGFDVMLDECRKVWFAEINGNPDMGSCHPVDLLVKHRLLQGTLDILCDGLCPSNFMPIELPLML